MNLSSASNTGCGKPYEMEKVSACVHIGVYRGRLMRYGHCAPEKKGERETENQTSTDGQENSLHL